jgi:basic membrane lipoprotein Med (substrate-binding protein (PBP1-ABC) superfamily)
VNRATFGVKLAYGFYLLSFTVTDILIQGAEEEKGHKDAESANMNDDGDSDEERIWKSIKNDGFKDDILTLLNYSFLSVTDKTAFKMHKLVQLATQEWLASNPQLGSKDEFYGQAPLSWAASYGQKTIVELLLEKGADVAFKDSKGWTAYSAGFRRCDIT